VAITAGGWEGGWGRWLLWVWMRVVAQNYREELLLALAMSAVAMKRPNSCSLPTLTILLLFIPPPFPLHSLSTSKGVCDTASAELAGWREFAALRPSMA